MKQFLIFFCIGVGTGTWHGPVSAENLGGWGDRSF